MKSIIRLALSRPCNSVVNSKPPSLPGGRLSRCISTSMTMNRPRIQLVLDFDGTITIDDTTAVIGSRCLAKARELAPTELAEDKLPKPMQYYSEKYMHDYRVWKSSLNQSTQIKTIDDEVSYLSQSKHIEEASFMRVRNAVLDVPGEISEMERNESLRDEFMMGAGRQAVRSGEVHIRDQKRLKRLLAMAEDERNSWGIVSVSWSRRFILGALIEAGIVKEGQEEDVVGRIRCNEILAPDYGNKAGKPQIICSARDKQDTLHQLLADWNILGRTQQSRHSINSEDNDTMITIYVGDSSTDIGSLAVATVGVYLHQGETEDDSVVQTLKRLDLQLLRIADLPTSNVPSALTNIITELRNKGKPPHFICLAQNFHEIDEWISKLYTSSG